MNKEFKALPDLPAAFGKFQLFGKFRKFRNFILVLCIYKRLPTRCNAVSQQNFRRFQQFRIRTFSADVPIRRFLSAEECELNDFYADFTKKLCILPVSDEPPKTCKLKPLRFAINAQRLVAFPARSVFPAKIRFAKPAVIFNLFKVRAKAVHKHFVCTVFRRNIRQSTEPAMPASVRTSVHVNHQSKLSAFFNVNTHTIGTPVKISAPAEQQRGPHFSALFS